MRQLICASIIPSDHSFRKFLEELPVNPACDPHPDFFETANSHRIMGAFNGDNANARMSLFREIVNAKHPPISIMTSSLGPNSASVIFFLNSSRRVAPGTSHSPSLAMMQADDDKVEAALSRIHHSVVPIPGARQMISY